MTTPSIGGLVGALLLLSGRDRGATLVGPHLPTFRAGFGRRRARRLLVRRGVVRRSHRRWLELVGEARGALAPPAIEGRVVDRPVVAAPDEDRGTGRLDLLAIGRCRPGSARARSRRPPRGRSRAAAARSARPNPTASPSRRRPSTLGAERRADDGRIAGAIGSSWRRASARRRRPRRGSAASPRRGPGGCPPRT